MTYGSYDNTQLGPPARLVKGYYGTWAFRKGKNALLLPVSMETARMATPDHLPQYNNHIVLTKQESPWTNIVGNCIFNKFKRRQKILTGMFPQLFDKLSTPPNKSTSWHGMTLRFLFQVLNSCPYFLNKLHNTLNKFNLREKLYVVRANKPSLLNKRTELTSKCRHKNKFYLGNFTSRLQ